MHTINKRRIINHLDFLKVSICENREISGRLYSKGNQMVGFERTRFYNHDIKPLSGAIFHVDSNDTTFKLFFTYGHL